MVKIINCCQDAFCLNLPIITLNRRSDSFVKTVCQCDDVLVKSVLQVEHCSFYDAPVLLCLCSFVLRCVGL